jgi:hypothetical protein
MFQFFYYSATVLFHRHTCCTCSTVRRWRNGNAIEVWEAHKVAVQTVLKLSTGELFTGKASAICFFPSQFLSYWFLCICIGGQSCSLLRQFLFVWHFDNDTMHH